MNGDPVGGDPVRARGGGAAAVARVGLALGGLAAMGVGAWVLLVDAAPQTPVQVATWLAGVLVVHDLLLAPLVLLVGLGLTRLPARRALRGGLLVAGCVTLVALPPLLRPGRPRNPTLLPLDYGHNLVTVLLAVAAATAATALATRFARRDRSG